MIKINNLQKRSKLGEGRNYGLGFAFLKRTKEDIYRTVMPISPCKDYLNDIVFSEATGKPCTAYGLRAKKYNIFDENYAYMVIETCHYQNDSKYNNFELERKLLIENLESLQDFIHWFEDKLELEYFSEMVNIDDNKVFIKLPLYWCGSTYLISMYSLLLRIGRWYKPGIDPMEYVKTFNSFSGDVYLAKQAAPKIEKILNVKEVIQDMDNMKPGTPVHNCGILCYS